MTQNVVLAVPMIKSFKVFKYFFRWQNKFFSIYLPVLTRSQTGIFFSFRNLDPQNSRLFSQEIKWFVAGICRKLMEYTSHHSPDTSLIPTF